MCLVRNEQSHAYSCENNALCNIAQSFEGESAGDLALRRKIVVPVDRHDHSSDDDGGHSRRPCQVSNVVRDKSTHQSESYFETSILGQRANVLQAQTAENSNYYSDSSGDQ